MRKRVHELHETIEPTTIVIFGASGELATRRLMPALFELWQHELLPKNFTIIGFSRRPYSNQEYRRFCQVRGKLWDKFARLIFYHPGNFTDPKDFQKLATHLHDIESRGHSCANRLFYYATLPAHYETISEELERSGLLIGCQLHRRETRVLVEKPFGQDLGSAQKLNATLQKFFAEGQIYRIDHYLGKETVQNILALRFANSIFEPIWNKNYIDHIQINNLERDGVGNRGAFYEQAGAIRDFLQSHILTLLSLLTIDAPTDLSTDAIRNERVKILKSLHQPSKAELSHGLIVGQYRGYRKERNVLPKSKVETFFAHKLFVNLPRWEQVPIYARTGKKLGEKLTEVSIYFKDGLPALFPNQKITPNILTFKIYPQEGIHLELLAKYPGFTIRLHPVDLTVGYQSAFRAKLPQAYVRLLLDFMRGNQQLFVRADEIEATWKYVDGLENYLAGFKNRKLISYQPGTWGPKESLKLIRKDKRQWHIGH